VQQFGLVKTDCWHALPSFLSEMLLACIHVSG